ncbi:MAG: serine protease [Rhodobacteraceae bacterium]|nr:serine protease [Paracoccaceae bacterium]
MARADLAGGRAALALMWALAVALAALAPGRVWAQPADAAAVAARPEIVGGRVVTETRFRNLYPWTVALLYSGAGWRQVCGATLIGPDWLLTAAHCVTGTVAEDWRALVGTRWLSRGGERFAATEIVIHPDYNRRTEDSDIALIHLERPVPGAVPVAPATLAESDLHARAGTRGTVLGWGATQSGGRGTVVLHEAQVPVVGLATCRRMHARRGQITDNMLCAGYREGGVDTCQGDSGGPLVVRGDGGRWLQVGVTSFGWGCARPRNPGVYTRVGRFQPWIAGQILERSH